ncbi:hypothetical protein E8D34_11585 [Nocardioides sp. GY 10113]|uniref:hypothetical protein n=1 Tax=Nocardioides sp. GY 10113 TaxID=2569761 RepID=UPI0010A8CC0C|nr:hypothetical protein [Nocardioides sp. GY 10113]TIC86309.1 hypothetical protein E8D34_11585 [Nocardioides sp. GY 10113]
MMMQRTFPEESAMSGAGGAGRRGKHAGHAVAVRHDGRTTPGSRRHRREPSAVGILGRWKVRLARL